METATRAEQIEAQIFGKYHLTSRPVGDAWCALVLDIAREYIKNELVFDQATLDQLTEDNAHTGRTAAEIVNQLRKLSDPGIELMKEV